ncbi:hypothetical protein D3C77_666190 [compost metagenome]
MLFACGGVVVERNIGDVSAAGLVVEQDLQATQAIDPVRDQQLTVERGKGVGDRDRLTGQGAGLVGPQVLVDALGLVGGYVGALGVGAGQQVLDATHGTGDRE